MVYLPDFCGIHSCAIMGMGNTTMQYKYRYRDHSSRHIQNKMVLCNLLKAFPGDKQGQGNIG